MTSTENSSGADPSQPLAPLPPPLTGSFMWAQQMGCFSLDLYSKWILPYVPCAFAFTVTASLLFVRYSSAHGNRESHLQWEETSLGHTPGNESYLGCWKNSLIPERERQVTSQTARLTVLSVLFGQMTFK